MSSIFSTAAFFGSAIVILALEIKQRQQQDRSEHNAGTSSHAASLSKDQVADLRARHFSKSVSVSYANSGSLMFVEVS
jgi:hypothetical protein